MKKTALPKMALLAFVAMLMTNVIWAAAAPVIKLTLEYIPPYTFLFIRFLAVCLLLLPYTIVELKKTNVLTSDFLKMALLGLFSQSSLILIFIGLKWTTSIDMVIISSIGPLLSMAVGHYLYHDAVNQKVKIGVGLATLGTLLVVIEPVLNQSQISISTTQRLVGNILIILYNLAFTLYVVWSKILQGETTKEVKRTLKYIHIKPMKKTYPTTLVTSVTFYVGMVSMLPFAILENLGYFGEIHYTLSALNTTAILGLSYMILLSSILAYFMFEWALKSTSVSDTALLGYTHPLVTIPVAYILLGEIPTQLSILGGIIIGIGVFIAESAAHRTRQSALVKH